MVPGHRSRSALHQNASQGSVKTILRSCIFCCIHFPKFQLYYLLVIMATVIDRDAITAAYEDVRSDDSETNWLFLAYEGTDIVLESFGVEYDEFVSKFRDDERAFGYVRVFTGDEMSKRAKFALITWIGSEVQPLKRAKVSTDKAFVKEIVKIFAKEILTNELQSLDQESVRQELIKAGGANYGTGSAYE